MGFKLTGIKEALANLRGVRRVTPKALQAAVHTEMQMLETYILQGRRIPVAKGALVTSLLVQPTKIQGNKVIGTIGVGGAASEYAAIVHEDRRGVVPRKGGQGGPKYLENPAKERAPKMGASIARRLAQAWKKAV